MLTHITICSMNYVGWVHLSDLVCTVLTTRGISLIKPLFLSLSSALFWGKLPSWRSAVLIDQEYLSSLRNICTRKFNLWFSLKFADRSRNKTIDRYQSHHYCILYIIGNNVFTIITLILTSLYLYMNEKTTLWSKFNNKI